MGFGQEGYLWLRCGPWTLISSSFNEILFIYRITNINEDFCLFSLSNLSDKALCTPSIIPKCMIICAVHKENNSIRKLAHWLSKTPGSQFYLSLSSNKKLY